MKQELMKSTQDALSIAETFHKSGMFTDIKSQAQAMVKIMAGAEMGISPFASMSGIHIIAGKPTIGAGLMAARVKSFGKYDYRVVEHNEKICSIDFYHNKEKIGNSTFTIDEAKKAGTKNLDKFPKNMLFARAMSNGVKWYTPDIYEAPVYVPEEMENVVDVTPEVVDPLPHIAAINETNSREELTEVWANIPSSARSLDIVIIAAKNKSTSFTTEN